MDTRVAILAIVVEERDKAEELNHVLHAYGKYIIGRMGIPYEKRGISLISVAALLILLTDALVLSVCVYIDSISASVLLFVSISSRSLASDLLEYSCI